MIDRVDKAIQRLADIRGCYESPPEEMLGERLREATAPGATFSSQVWVNTDTGRFRLDMLLVTTKGRRIGIEVDGREYHEPQRDHWRTVFILCAGEVDAIYRVPAASVYSNLVGVLAGLAAVEPDLFLGEFSNRWREAIRDLALEYEEAADEDEDGDSEGRDLPVRWSEYGASTSGPYLHRWDINCRSANSVKPYVEFIRSTGLRDIDALVQAWKDHHRPAEPDLPAYFDDLVE